ncbi:glycosyltransferase [Chitinophaga sp. 30R24]|uniref:glycosyltransferase n=1 Tax=Chitinophaga sp. 30R24 TaxID=3248838 RepID=UPI003B8F7F75
MNILFAGKFEAGYNRTKVILDGLEQLPGIQVSFYNFRERSKWNLFALRKACADADIIFLPSFTHKDVAWIKFFTRTPVIFDPLISRYLTKVFDYKQVKKRSLRGYKNFLKDKVAMHKADVVLCDTAAHRNYFHQTFQVPLSKLQVVEVGVNTTAFHPNTTAGRTQQPFTVGFYGGFIPLQGTRYIIEAANILKNHTDIRFHLIGEGFEYKQMRHLAEVTYGLQHITFSGWCKYDVLNEAINQFDICLGIFGDGLKADLVIPNKIYHYAALQKAIITKDTPAIHEIFMPNKNIVLTKNDPQEIADQILRLKANAVQRESIAQMGYEIITNTYNHKVIAQKVVDIAQMLLSTDKRTG